MLGARAMTANAARCSALALTAVMALLVACSTSPPTPIDTQQRLDAAVRSRPLVLLGEVHDNVRQHELRAGALRALLASGARPALLMEQFDRERQAEIDRALAEPDTDADRVIAAGTGGNPTRSGWDWTLYRPFVALALAYKLPLVAVNVSRADARRAIEGGMPALGLGGDVPPDIEAVQAQALIAGHCGQLGDAAARRLARGQVARDRVMAAALEAHAARGAVLLAGNGHVRSDIGVPRWLDSATRARSVAIGLIEAGDNAADNGRFDVTLATPRQSRPDPCAGPVPMPK